jgi:excinuclease ABC subunit A
LEGVDWFSGLQNEGLYLMTKKKIVSQLDGEEVIEILGAREHNLKNIDVIIPRHKLVTITGLSGSGKSSLAFDTIYAEGQRRYMESFSAYARSFIGNLEHMKPARAFDF